MKQPKELSRRRHLWSKYLSGGGILRIRLKVPVGIDPWHAAAAYHRDRSGPGQYFANVINVTHAKRREFIVAVRFGWDI